MKQYFISYKGFNKDGIEISFGSYVFNDRDKKDKVWFISPFQMALDSAKEHNKEVHSVHIIAMNRVWDGESDE